MDAKNLAVLQKLKESMVVQDVPAQVFTPLAIALLRDLAESFKSPDKQSKPRAKAPKKPSAPQPQTPKRAKSYKKVREEARKAEALRAELAVNKEKARKYRACRECGDLVHVGDQIQLHPVRCNHCKRRSEEIDLGIRSRTSSDFSAITVVQGGAPGLGKRK